ncbi:MAG: class I SAM-dependent methyltransferase [Planctomycetota bacterium]|jgi:demethylmenaquinone methyltransferase/2-methoxy-6-polyprenyl-1,4-benzoquinol methylase
MQPSRPATRRHRARAFQEMRRTLLPGGRAVILELTVPRSRLLRFGHHLYLRGVVLPVGWLIARSADAYRYLADSIADFTDPAEIGRMMDEAGFVDTRQVRMLGGTVTSFVGRAPGA